jgi:hypothetical protein
MEMDRDRPPATAGAHRRVGRIVVRGEFGLLERLRDLGAALVSVSIDP